MRWIGGACVLWAVLALFEIALIGRLDMQETPVGIAIALLATAVLVAGLRAVPVRYSVAASWAWLSILIVRNVVRDTFVVFGVLLHRLRGGAVNDEIQTIAFDAGIDDPRSAARRALAIAGVSTSPNGIVLSLEPDAATMHVHVLVASGERKHSAQWPL